MASLRPHAFGMPVLCRPSLLAMTKVTKINLDVVPQVCVGLDARVRLRTLFPTPLQILGMRPVQEPPRLWKSSGVWVHPSPLRDGKIDFYSTLQNTRGLPLCVDTANLDNCLESTKYLRGFSLCDSILYDHIKTVTSLARLQLAVTERIASTDAVRLSIEHIDKKQPTLNFHTAFYSRRPAFHLTEAATRTQIEQKVFEDFAVMDMKELNRIPPHFPEVNSEMGFFVQEHLVQILTKRYKHRLPMPKGKVLAKMIERARDNWIELWHKHVAAIQERGYPLTDIDVPWLHIVKKHRTYEDAALTYLCILFGEYGLEDESNTDSGLLEAGLLVENPSATLRTRSNSSSSGDSSKETADTEMDETLVSNVRWQPTGSNDLASGAPSAYGMNHFLTKRCPISMKAQHCSVGTDLTIQSQQHKASPILQAEGAMGANHYDYSSIDIILDQRAVANIELQPFGVDGNDGIRLVEDSLLPPPQHNFFQHPNTVVDVHEQLGEVTIACSTATELYDEDGFLIEDGKFDTAMGDIEVPITPYEAQSHIVYGTYPTEGHVCQISSLATKSQRQLRKVSCGFLRHPRPAHLRPNSSSHPFGTEDNGNEGFAVSGLKYRPTWFQLPADILHELVMDPVANARIVSHYARRFSISEGQYRYEVCCKIEEELRDVQHDAKIRQHEGDKIMQATYIGDDGELLVIEPESPADGLIIAISPTRMDVDIWQV